MKTPPYKLQTYMNVKADNKEAAVKHLGEMQRQLIAEEEKKRMLEAELVQFKQTKELRRRELINLSKQQPMAGQKEVMKCKTAIDYSNTQIESQIVRIKQQDQEIEKAKNNVEKAQELLQIASKELKVVEKHKEKWEAEQYNEWKRKQQKIQNEIGNVLHTYKQG